MLLSDYVICIRGGVGGVPPGFLVCHHLCGSAAGGFCFSTLNCSNVIICRIEHIGAANQSLAIKRNGEYWHL